MDKQQEFQRGVNELPNTYYRGFYILEPKGNNAFSFEKRNNKRIYVVPLVKGSVDDLAAGREVAFSEIKDGVEFNQTGLKNLVFHL